MMELMVPVSAGELIDKITILEIKADRIADPDKHANVVRERDALMKIRDREIPASRDIDRLASALRYVNEKLWDVEDAIRRCEAADDFGPQFVLLARDVYFTNDRRAALKKEINTLTGSALVEEKSYEDYRQSA